MDIQFQFASLEAFIHMNGHGLYVWLAYGFVLTLLALLIIAPVISSRRFFKEQQRLILLSQQRQQQKQPVSNQIETNSD